MYNFDEEINKCPSHGLSMDSDFLCAVCKLELNGKAPEAYRKCTAYESTATNADGVHTWATWDRRATDKLKKEAYIPKSAEELVEESEEEEPQDLWT